MTNFNYKELSTAEQIKAFYSILNSADIGGSYNYEIDKYYLELILSYIEKSDYDLETMINLVHKVSILPKKFVLDADCAIAFYDDFLLFRNDLFKKYNIELPN